MDGTLGDSTWGQIAEIVIYIVCGYVSVLYLGKKIFPSNEFEEAEPLLPDGWEDGREVTPETLEAGRSYLRKTGEVLVFLRKAEKDEYRQDVEEWLFHPPGQEGEFWVGLTREQFSELRKSGKHP